MFYEISHTTKYGLLFPRNLEMNDLDSQALQETEKGSQARFVRYKLHYFCKLYIWTFTLCFQANKCYTDVLYCKDHYHFTLLVNAVIPGN